MMTGPTHLDGNAAAGAFAEVLGLDVTTATPSRGTSCRAMAFAESHVYHRRRGIVARCPVGEDVLAQLVQTSTDVWLDSRGAQSWRVPIPAR
ncbi:hypothetical protein AWC29_28065 [Mycobacterium triplex]|uniref:Uncharacterized protein n=2 Tax=Mycobacterium triplex TaxID=47839 RepID=A0A024JVC3_9MYCO|nr:hypothetical protein AWC29_28065 [Mycobacterium triplex]CDO87581.1 hypothetical protein BN973_01936 [Mycobacterium triplex]